MFLLSILEYPEVNGCLEVGDNILAFMPLRQAEALRKRPLERSKEMVESTIGGHKDKDNFYVPQEEGERIIGL